jgi:hypothetical protein
MLGNSVVEIWMLGNSVVDILASTRLCKYHCPTANMKTVYRRTSINGTTFSGIKCLSGTIFHAIRLDFSMLFDNF